MSGKGAKSLPTTKPPLTSGEEPTELLLALLWSPLETLLANGKAKVFVGKGAIAIFLHGVELIPLLGLVLADKEEKK